MKKIICIFLCLLMVAASLAGCVEKQLTFEEAAEAGKEFAKSEGLKDVKIVNEADGEKLTLEGKYDYVNNKAVLSVSIESKDTIHTFKDMIKLDGTKLFVKIPDMSGLTDMLGGLTSGKEVYEDKSPFDTSEFDMAGGFGFDMTDLFGLPDNLAGKYVEIKLSENKPETLKGIISESEDDVYEKAEKLEAEEDYPYVVRYTQKDAYDLLISVLDGIKAKKKEISAEAAASIKEYIGEENCKTAQELSDKTVEEIIEEGIDEFFKEVSPEDLAPDDAEEFELIQKIAYDKDKKLQYVFMYDLKNGEETHSVKTYVTVSAAEEDEAFAEKCFVPEDELFDAVSYLKDMLDTLKMFANVQNMFG